MEEGPLIRVVGLLTTSDHKVNELTTSLSMYGVGVVKLDPACDYVAYLESSTPKFKILCVLKEQTYLYQSGTQKPAMKTQLELVDHVSHMTVMLLNIHKELRGLQGHRARSDLAPGQIAEEIDTYEFVETTEGYLDYAREISGSAESKYDWDDVFVVITCHLSYLQLSAKGKKISSRDKNISKVIKQIIHYKKPIDLAHHPQHYARSIDFSRTFWEYAKTIPEFDSEYVHKFRLRNILITAMNQGVLLRSDITRRGRLYWLPGLNAGIPLTPKPKDPKHELTFQFHDISHHNIPDLVFDGVVSPLHKKVYIAYRLMSEAITLVLADMIFVNSLIRSGFKYETVNQRRIYPVFQEMETSIDGNLEPIIHKILLGSFMYCFFHDTSVWESMMINTEPLKQFTSKFDAYFMEDFRWTLHNYEDMAKSPDVFTNWWSNVKDLRKSGVNLELQSVSEFIEEQHLTGITNQTELLTAVFNGVYNKYIKRLFVGGIIEMYRPEDQLRNAFLRYMMGQSIIFFQHDYYHESRIYFEHIRNCLTTDFLDRPLIDNIRRFYDSYLCKLEHANLITPDDRINYSEVCPLFSPMIVDYDHLKNTTPYEQFVQQILN